MEGEIIHRDLRIALFTATEIRMALVFLNSVLIRTTWPSSLWSEFKGWNMPVVYYRELITMQWWWGHSFEQKCKMFENDNWQTLGAREREQAVSGGFWGHSPTRTATPSSALFPNMKGNEWSLLQSAVPISQESVSSSLRNVHLPWSDWW